MCVCEFRVLVCWSVKSGTASLFCPGPVMTTPHSLPRPCRCAFRIQLHHCSSPPPRLVTTHLELIAAERTTMSPPPDPNARRWQGQDLPRAARTVRRRSLSTAPSQHFSQCDGLRHRPPHRQNAVDRSTATALHTAFTSFAHNPLLRVAILTGAGGTFCAGADLKSILLSSSGEGTGNLLTRTWTRWRLWVLRGW